jgi:hypothetical protein
LHDACMSSGTYIDIWSCIPVLQPHNDDSPEEQGNNGGGESPQDDDEQQVFLCAPYSDILFLQHRTFLYDAGMSSGTYVCIYVCMYMDVHNCSFLSNWLFWHQDSPASVANFQILLSKFAPRVSYEQVHWSYWRFWGQVHERALA